MSATGPEVFDKTLQTSNIRLDDIITGQPETLEPAHAGDGGR